MPGPLDGVRVVDVSQMISGPVCARILGDQGAEVIKVESPSGDLTRGLGGAGRGMSPIFATSNRNKRSVVLDLKKPSAVACLKRLVAEADVFVQNFRPGAVERMGIDEPSLRAVREDLIYVSISGFGESGPYAHKRVYDPVIQALSGLAAIQGGSSGRPRMLRLIVPDKLTALTAAQNITAALFARSRSGEGQHLRLAMLDATIAFLWPEGMVRHTFIGDDIGHSRPTELRELVFETQDGFMTAGTVAHREFVAFCRATGNEDWLEDPRFRSTAGLVKHADARLEMMAEVLKQRTTEEWCRLLDEAEVPCAPILTREELCDHPQIRENEIVIEDVHPHAGRMRQARPPERFDRTPAAIRRPAPLLGEHTAEVLGELGYDAAQLASLRAEGAIPAE